MAEQDALLVDQARLKAQNLERGSVAAAVKDLKEREQQIKRTVQQIDILEAHNASLARRIEALQAELQLAKKSSGGWFGGGGSGLRKELDETRQHLEVLTAELHSKIQENETLHHDMYESVQKKDQAIEQLNNEIHNLESAVSAHLSEINDLKGAHFETITHLKSEKYVIERTLSEMKVSLKSAHELIKQTTSELEEQKHTCLSELQGLHDALKHILDTEMRVDGGPINTPSPPQRLHLPDKYCGDCKILFQLETKLFDLLSRRVGIQLQQYALEELSLENSQLLEEFNSFSRLSKKWLQGLPAILYPSTAWFAWVLEVVRYHIADACIRESLSEETSMAHDIAAVHTETFPITQSLDALRTSLSLLETNLKDESVMQRSIDLAQQIRSPMTAFVTHMSRKLHTESILPHATQDIKNFNAVIISTLAQLMQHVEAFNLLPMLPLTSESTISSVSHVQPAQSADNIFVSVQDCRGVVDAISVHISSMRNKTKSLQEQNYSLQNNLVQDSKTMDSLQAAVKQSESDKASLTLRFKQLEQQFSALRVERAKSPPRPLTEHKGISTVALTITASPVHTSTDKLTVNTTTTQTESLNPSTSTATQVDSSLDTTAVSTSKTTQKADNIILTTAKNTINALPEKQKSQPLLDKQSLSMSAKKRKKKKNKSKLNVFDAQPSQDNLVVDAEDQTAIESTESTISSPTDVTVAVADESLLLPPLQVTEVESTTIDKSEVSHTSELMIQQSTVEEPAHVINVTIDEKHREQVLCQFYENKATTMTTQLQYAHAKAIRYYEAYTQLLQRQHAQEEQHTASITKLQATNTSLHKQKEEQNTMEATLRSELKSLRNTHQSCEHERNELEKSYKNQFDVMSEEILQLQIRIAELESAAEVE